MNGTELTTAIRRLLGAFLVGTILLGWSPIVSGQYFGRNKIQYDNFDWQVLSTPHFEIFFYEEEEDLAARAAVIVEDAYLRLSQLFDHELSSQVPFVLYASPNDFQQTNIADDLIGEGTGGFSEPTRNRMVLPYPGDNEGFVHVINHELVHVFMFDIAYASTQSHAARRAFFPIPLWFAEGMAEWFSSGWDHQADMWMRDAIIYDWAIPLPYIYGGFQVYKEGQSAMRFMAQTYGEEKVVEFFKNVGRTRNVDRSLMNVVGIDVETFSENWIKAIKQEYWPLYGDKQEASHIGRRLTDHVEENAYFFQQPSLSPDGRWIAFFSDYDGLVDLYLMDALEGKIIRKLVTGYRSNRFLTLHSFESSIGFSPDSERICFVARSGRDEVLYVVRVRDGKILQDIPLDMDIARSPAWSPTEPRVVVNGTRGGQTDLYLIDLDAESVERLTNSVSDEHSPAWYPDGRQLLYSSFPETTVEIQFVTDERGVLRLAPVDFGQSGNVQRVGADYDLMRLDLRSGEVEAVVSTEGADTDPVVIDEDRILFVSDLNGVSNLYLYEIGEGRLRRLTDVLGGLFHPTVSPGADALAFSAFEHGGWDIFLTENFDEFLASEGYPTEMETEFLAVPGGPPAPGPQLFLPEPDAVTVSLTGEAEATGGRVIDGTLARLASAENALARLDGEEQPAPAPRWQEADTSQPEPEEEEGRPIGTVEPYKLRFSLDPVGSGYGGVYYTEGVGLGVANVVSLSDLLGNHRMQFLVNFYGSIKYSDLAASYYYLKRRMNFAGGVFHYRNFYNSNFTSLGEVFDRSELFSERNYGIFGLASYPLTQFDRIDLELQAFISEKTFYDYVDQGTYGLLVQTGEQEDRLIQPSLSYVHDSAFYGPHGPVTGSRWLLNVSPAIPLSDEDVDRTTTFLDYRRYFIPFSRNSLAFRFVGAVSNGGTPRNFVVGGPSTLRGWDIFDFEKIDPATGDFRHENLLGRKMLLMNVEYRFPFVDALILGWPGRFGIGNIGGAVFFDAGAAFNDEFQPFGESDSGSFMLRDLNADIGFGIRANLGFLPLKFDWAWKTDFVQTGGPVQFNFSIGPEF